MERILVVLSADGPDEPTLEFAIRMAARARTKLTGLLLQSPALQQALHPAQEAVAGFRWQTGESVSVNAPVSGSVEQVKEACRHSGIAVDVIINAGEPLEQVIYESRFADYLIVDPATNFLPAEGAIPSRFVREILCRAECPVLLPPREFAGIDEVVFCYDGSASAVFAIKQFTALLPHLKTPSCLLLEVNQTGKALFDDDHKRMMIWLKMHYGNVRYQTLKGNAKDELFNHLFMKTKKMVVMGAYGRSLLSSLFKRSHADAIIRMVDLPLFVAHS